MTWLTYLRRRWCAWRGHPGVQRGRPELIGFYAHPDDGAPVWVAASSTRAYRCQWHDWKPYAGATGGIDVIRIDGSGVEDD
jgi:hypothetical protein